MKRILVFLFASLCMTAMGANGDICRQGDQNPPKQNEPYKIPVDEHTSRGKLSYDPNEIIGPEGYDSVQWVSINDELSYTILFENDPEFATAAAQKVDVRFDFQDKAWMKGFGIGSYSFSNMSFPVDKPSNAYQQRIDLKDSLGYYVDLIGGLDVAHQQGFWTFNTIDPETGYAPMQVETGMLPVNDSTHVGEGAVTFWLRPYSGLHTGDTISIQARIVFDQNDTIPTNRWTNWIDAGMPDSELTASIHPTLPNIYNLKFSGKDDEGGSGLRHILLYQANHNGIYEEIDTCAVDSVLAFPVEAGKQYKLYSIAVDNAGNREPAKMEPDVILNFNQAPTDIVLSDTVFEDDLAAGGYIGTLTSVDSEDSKAFTYALSEGDGAIHNDLFQISGDQLQIKGSFKSAEDSLFKVRLSTTDEGGLSYSKPFVLYLKNVLERPKVDTIVAEVCNGDIFVFKDVEYDKTGVYHYSKSNDYMRDSTFVINLTVHPHLEAPLVTVEGSCTLVSSNEMNNVWFKEDGTPVAGETGQKFTPTEDGIYYVAVRSGSCYSEPSIAYRVQLSDKIDLDMNLAKGWNWISSNLSDACYQKAKDFVSPISAKVERLIGFDSELIHDPTYGLMGNLINLVPAESYLIQLNDTAANVWGGIAYKPETTTVSLKKGWNWLGYIPVMEHSVSKALEELSPHEGDVIKSYEGFAVYNGAKWVGTLESMHPGMGYMYYSSMDAQFHYPAVRVFEVDNGRMQASAFSQSQENVPWHVEKNKYPYNMTMIAEVYAGGLKALAGNYTIGAFVGDECRGVGQYVDDMLYMTIYGELAKQETVSFKAYDNVTDSEYDVVESLMFDNKMVGSVISPFKLTVNGTTGIAGQDISNSYNIYPNPVRMSLYINGDIAKIKAVSILSDNGATLLRNEGYTTSGINVSRLPGAAYVVVIDTEDGIVIKKIIKAN